MRKTLLALSIVLSGCVETTAYLTPEDVIFCNKICSGAPELGAKEIGKSIIIKEKIVCKCLDGAAYDMQRY